MIEREKFSSEFNLSWLNFGEGPGYLSNTHLKEHFLIERFLRSKVSLSAQLTLRFLYMYVVIGIRLCKYGGFPVFPKNYPPWVGFAGLILELAKPCKRRSLFSSAAGPSTRSGRRNRRLRETRRVWGAAEAVRGGRGEAVWGGWGALEGVW